MVALGLGDRADPVHEGQGTREVVEAEQLAQVVVFDRFPAVQLGQQIRDLLGGHGRNTASTGDAVLGDELFGHGLSSMAPITLPMRSERTPAGLALAALIGVAAVKLALATHWDLLADEAYYAIWSMHPAWGYYDQPPLIAWILWLSRQILGDTDLAIRLPAIVCGVIAPLVLLDAVGDRALWLGWWVGIPVLAWLTGFATPDALLLLAWAAAIAAAHRGGRAWLLAGVAVAIGIYAKYTAAVLLPLLWIGTGDWRSRWMWAGSALTGLLLLPHAAWLASHELVSVGFQLREGLWNPNPPGWTGPFAVFGQQLGVATPFAVLALGGALWARPLTRIDRLAWWTTAPVALIFLLASIGGPPEAHWLAPVWVSGGVLISHRRGWIARSAWVAVGTGFFASLLLVLHTEYGVFPLRSDPADRIREGRPLAYAVGSWALPLGVAPREPRATESIPVRTERYQEAALIAWYTGIPAVAQPECARPDQYDLWPSSSPDALLFVRPARSGDTLCTDSAYPDKTRHPLAPRDNQGRTVGRWDLFEVRR